MTIREYSIQNLTCANCGNKIETEILRLPEVSEASLDLLNGKLVVQYHSNIDNALERLNRIASSIEPGVSISESEAAAASKESVWKVMPIFGRICH